MPTTRRHTVRLLVAAFLAAPAGSRAQDTSRAVHRLGPVTAAGEPRVQGGVAFAVGQPRGAFRRYVDNGLGVAAHALYRVDRLGAFAVRLDGGILNYGRGIVHLPLSDRPGGGRVPLDVTTTNNIAWLGFGPQLMAARGVARPYVNATLGVSYFATVSSASGHGDAAAFADYTNLHDTPVAWGTGAGILVPVRRGSRTLLFLDAGARYHDNGRSVRYLREGGVRDLSDGSVQLDVIRSRADLVTWYVGMSVGAR